MKIKAVLNRDGGTFKTTDMQTYCETAMRAFAAKGHELDCAVVAGDEITYALEAASEESGVEAIVAGGGDGTISAAAGMAWESGLPLGVIPAGTMN
ncbi:MAG: diacylglycerol/lipid kinase family protein, partial [Allorhizobium sp.]